MTTVSALVAQAAGRFKDPNYRVITAAQWVNYLNQCYKKVNNATPLWPWNESVEAQVNIAANDGTINPTDTTGRRVALPTDMWQVNWVYNVTADYRMIPQEGRGDQWHQDHLRSEVGQPVTYRIVNQNLEVFPLCEAAYTFALEGMQYPAALSLNAPQDLTVAGGAAGSFTVTGIDVGDTLLSVVKVDDTTHAGTDITADVSISALNTILTTVSTTGTHIVVTWQSMQPGTDSPVYPQSFHEDLLDGMLALAYLDDGSTEQYTAHWAAFTAAVKQMEMHVLSFRTETYVPIRDVFWS